MELSIQENRSATALANSNVRNPAIAIVCEFSILQSQFYRLLLILLVCKCTPDVEWKFNGRASVVV